MCLAFSFMSPISYSVCDSGNLNYVISAYADTSSCTSPPPPVVTPSRPPAPVVASPPPPSSLQSCQCACCKGNYCSATLVGSFNVSIESIFQCSMFMHIVESPFNDHMLPCPVSCCLDCCCYCVMMNAILMFKPLSRFHVLQAASATLCTTSSCVQAYPDTCPTANEPGSSGSSYHEVQSTASSSSSAKTVSGAIALDTSTVTDTCKAVSFFQCVMAYSVAVSGSGFTLTSTSGDASTCGTGNGKLFFKVQNMKKFHNCCSPFPCVLQSLLKLQLVLSFVLLVVQINTHCRKRMGERMSVCDWPWHFQAKHCFNAYTDSRT